MVYGLRRHLAVAATRVAGLGAALLPPRCLLCGEPGTASLDLCAACHQALPRNQPACVRCALPLAAAGTCGACLHRPPLLATVRAAFVYTAPLDRLLPRYKFRGDLAAGRLLARLMLAEVAGCDPPQALVPVPLHRARLRQRGYNQSLELARPVARALRLPLCHALVRARPTLPQAGLPAAQRRANVRGAFAPVADLSGARVALVDDVMTSGATADAAAASLRAAGAASVEVWVVARA